MGRKKVDIRDLSKTKSDIYEGQDTTVVIFLLHETFLSSIVSALSPFPPCLYLPDYRDKGLKQKVITYEWGLLSEQGFQFINVISVKKVK